MRVYVPVIISVLVGAIVGGALFLLPFARRSGPPSGVAAPQIARPPTVTPASPPATPAAGRPTPAPVATPRPTVVPSPPAVALASPVADGAGGDQGADALARARALLAAGRWRDAQDEYIQVLLVAPDNEAAMRELVALRRRLAGNDAALLRRQASAYRRAIARGEETEEHYTVPAMRILAQASILAAQEIEQGAPPPAPQGTGSTPIVLQATPAHRPTQVRPTLAPTATPAPPQAVRVTPRPRRTPRPTPPPAPPTARPAAPSPSPSPAPTIQPTVEATLDANEPFLVVHIGPLYTASRASEVAAELTIAGYAARVTRPGNGTTYLVTLGPYRRSVTDAVVRLMRSRFPGIPVSVVPAP